MVFGWLIVAGTIKACSAADSLPEKPVLSIEKWEEIMVFGQNKRDKKKNGSPCFAQGNPSESCL